MAWIESHQELGKHPKTKKLARILGVSLPAVVGHLHFFWWWAMDFAEDGNLSRYDEYDIADACEWDGDAKQLLDALVQTGFVDETENGLEIHDWFEYAGRLIEKREANKERARKSRERNAQRARNVRATNADVATLPKPNLNQNQNNKSIADSDEIGETFDRFWKAYPKKQGKAAALKKWRTLYKQGKIDIEFILERLRAYIAFVEAERQRGFDRQFMDGSTFVNQERWNDEWAVIQPRAPNVHDDYLRHEIELNQRMRDKNEPPLDWFYAQ